MKLVWISNAPPIDIDHNQKSFGGGWLQEQYSSLTTSNNMQILALFPGKAINDLSKGIVTFSPVKNNKYSIKKAKMFFKKILTDFKPNLIHIHGTELPHCYSMSLAAIELNIPYVVSLQGIVSEIYKHVLTGMDPKDMFKKSLRDLIFRSSTIDLRNLYKRLALLEKSVVLHSSIVIGRTNWDKAWITFNFQGKKYRFSSEPLRKDFLNSRKWEYDKCNKYQIFLSQSNTSIKGLHILLHALAYVKLYFPSLQLVIAGKNYSTNTLRNIFLRTAYENTILRYISILNLKNNIKFVGPQNPNQMIEHLLESHVFVQPSVIENSPNSLMEAIYLDVPSIASDVGGISSLYKSCKNLTLYQSDSSLILASHIKDLFEKKNYSTNNFTQIHNDVGPNLIKIYNEAISE